MKYSNGNDTDFNFGWNVKPGSEEAKEILAYWGHDQPKTPSYDAVESTCKWVKEQIFFITKTVRKANRMLPEANSNTKKSSNRSSGDVPFLKPEHLSRQPKEAKILEVQYQADAKFGPRILTKLALDGHRFLASFPVSGTPGQVENYQIMKRQFGGEENDWLGKTILLGLEQDSMTERWFIKVSLPNNAKAAKNRD